jgi:hypothetical protein
MPKPRPTKPSTPRLSELARHVVIPKGTVTTGWPVVRDKCRDLGISFRPWQPGVGQVILAKRADGKYAATIGGTGMSIPRQVGKTFLVGAIVFALCLLRPGLTVIWTAHRLRTADETFGKMQVFAKRKRIAPHILKLILGSGEEEIQFRNGSRILFGARERGFGRGFDEVDVLIFDESQILGDAALDDMIPATNQSRQETGALLIFMGTPPKPSDPSEVHMRMRTEALSGEDHDTGWVEFGADEGYRPTPLPAELTPADWAQVAKANPSYPQDTPREAILRMRKKLGAESFLREGMGIYDKNQGNAVISSQAWAQCLDPDSQITSAPVFALDVSPNRSWAAIGVAGVREDGRPHVEVTSIGGGLVDHRTGVEWVVPRCVDLKERWPGMRLIIASGSAAESLVPALIAADIDLDFIKANDVAAACGLFYDLATTSGLRHRGHAELTAALAAARKSVDDPERAWRWGRKKSAGDITPLYAATLALWVVMQADTPDVSVFFFDDLDDDDSEEDS